MESALNNQRVTATKSALAGATDPIELPGTEGVRSRQRLGQKIAATMLAGVCVAGLFALLRLTAQDSLADGPITPAGGPPTLFQNWGKPALAIVISGQQYGYLQPCGCSSPQYGGLARRFNFLQMLRQEQGWPLIAVDLGDVAQKKTNPHLGLKIKYAMKSLEVMGYSAVGIGQSEMAMPLIEAIASHRLNSPFPKMFASTLLDPATAEVIRTHVDGAQVVRAEQIGAPAVGVFSLIGPSVANQVTDKDLTFANNQKKVIEELISLGKAKAAITLLLYQGTIEEAKLVAEYCAAERKNVAGLPALDLVLCLSAEEEPPSVPTEVNGAATLIYQIGHKGRYVGVIGAFPAAKGYQFRYQLVSIGPKFETKAGQEKGHKVMDLMAQYAKEVFDEKLITKFPTSMHPVQVAFPNAKYVGSERCASCHKEAHKIWEHSGHAHAFQTLVNVKHPPLRQHDGECVVCHTVGFSHPTGYADALRENNEKRIVLLKDVGCESCHGPGSEHVKAKHNQDIHKLMNPWKYAGENRLKNINMFCQKCHDIDNDVHWNFEKKWPKIIHETPKQAAGNVQPKQAAPPLDPPVAQPEPVSTPVPQQPATSPMATPPGERDAKLFPKLFKKLRQD